MKNDSTTNKRLKLQVSTSMYWFTKLDVPHTIQTYFINYNWTAWLIISILAKGYQSFASHVF